MHRYCFFVNLIQKRCIQNFRLIQAGQRYRFWIYGDSYKFDIFSEIIYEFQFWGKPVSYTDLSRDYNAIVIYLSYNLQALHSDK